MVLLRKSGCVLVKSARCTGSGSGKIQTVQELAEVAAKLPVILEIPLTKILSNEQDKAEKGGKK